MQLAGNTGMTPSVSPIGSFSEDFMEQQNTIRPSKRSLSSISDSSLEDNRKRRKFTHNYLVEQPIDFFFSPRPNNNEKNSEKSRHSRSRSAESNASKRKRIELETFGIPQTIDEGIESARNERGSTTVKKVYNENTITNQPLLEVETTMTNDSPERNVDEAVGQLSRKSIGVVSAQGNEALEVPISLRSGKDPIDSDHENKIDQISGPPPLEPLQQPQNFLATDNQIGTEQEIPTQEISTQEIIAERIRRATQASSAQQTNTGTGVQRVQTSEEQKARMREEHQKQVEFWTKIHERVNNDDNSNVVNLNSAQELEELERQNTPLKTPPPVQDYMRTHDHILSVNVLKEICLSSHRGPISKEQVNILKDELRREVSILRQIRNGRVKRKSNGATFLGNKIVLIKSSSSEPTIVPKRRRRKRNEGTTEINKTHPPEIGMHSYRYEELYP